MKLIKVTEQNFEQILHELQKRCNKYKMLEWYSVFKEAGPDKKVIREKKYNRTPYHWIGPTKKLYIDRTFVHATKHRFREAFESGSDSFEKRLYDDSDRKPFIHLSTGSLTALMLGDGDYMQFIPGGGFIIYDSNEHIKLDEAPLSIYRHIFFPSIICGHIKDLEHEIQERHDDEERNAEAYNRLMEEAYYNEYDGYDEYSHYDDSDLEFWD